MACDKLPRMILFDLGGTAIANGDDASDDLPAAMDRLRLAAVDPGAATAAQMCALWREFFAETKGGDRRSAAGHRLEIPLPAALDYITMNAGLRFPPGTDRQSLLLAFQDFSGRVTPGFASLLETIGRLGIRTAVISNNEFTGDVLEREFRRVLPNSRMEFCLSSADVLFCKPAGPLFRTAARFAGVDPDDCWYCGDGFTPDVIGGLDAGMHPVHYRPAADARLVRLTDGAGREYLAVNHWNALEEHLLALARQNEIFDRKGF